MHSRLSTMLNNSLFNQHIKLRKVIGLPTRHPKNQTMFCKRTIHHFLCIACFVCAIECKNGIFVFEVAKLRQISAYFACIYTVCQLKRHAICKVCKPKIFVFVNFRLMEVTLSGPVDNVFGCFSVVIVVMIGVFVSLH